MVRTKALPRRSPKPWPVQEFSGSIVFVSSISHSPRHAEPEATWLPRSFRRNQRRPRTNSSDSLSPKKERSAPRQRLDKEARELRNLQAAKSFVEICISQNGPDSRKLLTQKHLQRQGMNTNVQVDARDALKKLGLVEVVSGEGTVLSEDVANLSAMLLIIEEYETEALTTGNLESAPNSPMCESPHV